MNVNPETGEVLEPVGPDPRDSAHQLAALLAARQEALDTLVKLNDDIRAVVGTVSSAGVGSSWVRNDGTVVRVKQVRAGRKVIQAECDRVREQLVDLGLVELKPREPEVIYPGVRAIDAAAAELLRRGIRPEDLLQLPPATVKVTVEGPDGAWDVDPLGKVGKAQ